jgi:hypothetical protein
MDPQLFGGAFVFYFGFRTIAFPLGLLALYLVEGVLSASLFPTAPSPEGQMWATGLTVAIVRYAQWFQLVPWLVRRATNARGHTGRISLELEER